MINWRDVRNKEEHDQCVKEILSLPWEQKEPILKEMSDYLESFKEVRELGYRKQPEATRKTRRRRRS